MAEPRQGQEFQEGAADLDEGAARELGCRDAVDFGTQRARDVLDRDSTPASHEMKREKTDPRSERARPREGHRACEEPDHVEGKDLESLAERTERRAAHV